MGSQNSPSNESPLPQKPGPYLAVWIAVGLVILIIGLGAGLVFWKILSSNLASPPGRPSAPISSYDDCLKAKGSIVQYSYPGVCITTGGQRFIQPLTDEERKNLQPPDVNSEPTGSSKETEGAFCGGFAGKLCSQGYECRLEGNYPDASGICVKK